MGDEMKKKKFRKGQRVDVQREPSASWESAEYHSAASFPGHHVVVLPLGRERRVDVMTGDETGTNNPRSYLTRHLCVPSRRIRAAHRHTG